MSYLGAVNFAAISDIYEAREYATSSAKAAASKCPKSAAAYKGVVADIDNLISKYLPDSPPHTTVATAKQQIESANVLCRAEAKAAGVIVGPLLTLDVPYSQPGSSMLAIFAVAAVGAYLIFS